MSHGAEEIRKHVRVYVGAFVALMILTVLTVAVAQFHLPIAFAVSIALIIAAVKGSLVASFFMHLIAEKKAIYAALLLTAVFLLALVFLPLLGHADRVGHYTHAPGPAKAAVGH